MKKEISLITIGVFLIILDRLTKILFTKKQFFIINYLENYGSFLGLISNKILIILISIIIIFILAFIYRKNKTLQIRLALILIISGLLSNLIDRVYLGYIIDFIDIRFWPIFNLADLYITIGIIITLINIRKW